MFVVLLDKVTINNLAGCVYNFDLPFLTNLIHCSVISSGLSGPKLLARTCPECAE